MPPKKNTPAKSRYHKPSAGTPSASKRNTANRNTSDAANVATTTPAPAPVGSSAATTNAQPAPATPEVGLFGPNLLLAQEPIAQKPAQAGGTYPLNAETYRH